MISTYTEGDTDPCIGSGKEDDVCTKLARGGPNNATYITGFTILDREHTAIVGIEDLGTQLTVQVDGKRLLLDPTVHSNALVQNWQFPSKDGNSLNVSWERYDAYHAAPQVNFTARAATYTIWLNYEQQGRPARLTRTDSNPVINAGPSDRVNPTAAGFGGRAFEVSDLDSDSVYCLLSSPFHQVGARIVKAGPDNATVYMTGMGIMYKEHEILVEVNNDGSGVILTIDGQDLKLSNGWFEDSWTYNCQTGGSVSVLWQLYRPLLGNTVEITTDVLSMTIWLVPARKENIAVNVPPYLNAETTVLQDINDTGYFQGMLGETYDRFIAGDAVKTKTSPLYLPDDNKFHGIGKRAQYKMDSYWDTNHTFALYNATSFPDEALRLREAKNLPQPSAAIFNDAQAYTNWQPAPKAVDKKRLAIVLSVLLSALVLSSCLCFVVGYHRHNIRKAFRLPRALSASLKLPLHYERHQDSHKT
ncbi:g8079 [Coccomyxa viridis]|uniref:G8079 protein n=1 Tax=Coccomyxa viridis TaxID=1274662 RepID=A0ABP1G5Z5_9CHLO